MNIYVHIYIQFNIYMTFDVILLYTFFFTISKMRILARILEKLDGEKLNYLMNFLGLRDICIAFSSFP